VGAQAPSSKLFKGISSWHFQMAQAAISLAMAI
jgi:hypothetical protein